MASVRSRSLVTAGGSLTRPDSSSSIRRPLSQSGYVFGRDRGPLDSDNLYNAGRLRARHELESALTTRDPVAQQRRLVHSIDRNYFDKGMSDSVQKAKSLSSSLSRLSLLDSLFRVNANRGRALESGNEGGYGWIRFANEEQDRADRRSITELTRQVLEAGGYILPGGDPVRLVGVDKMIQGTMLISPAFGNWPKKHLVKPAKISLSPLPECSGKPTRLSISQGVVFDVVQQRCALGQHVVAVNAASAYHVGGGFLTGGRHALEEAMCTQSSLFGSLERASELSRQAGVKVPDWATPSMHRDWSGLNREWQMHLPEDGVVLSPSVEVFRTGSDLGYPFREKALKLTAVVSVAMPNCNNQMTDSPVDAHPNPSEYVFQLERKWRAVLAAAAHYTKAECLVVPDAGCGVFRNPPRDVGAAFGRVLRCEFAGHFSDVVIAFPGGPNGEEFAEAATAAFNDKPVPPARAGGPVWPPDHEQLISRLSTRILEDDWTNT